MSNYQYRDAQTGEFVTQEFAEAHPDVTVREVVTGHVGYAPGYAGGPVFFGDPKVIQDNPVPGGVGSLKITPPDLLALQARVAQLEAALETIATNTHNRDGSPKYTLAADLAQQALSTPAPNVSPLWGKFAEAIRIIGRRAYIHNRDGEITCHCDYCHFTGSITPELRALIAEMATLHTVESQTTTITNSYSQAKGGRE